MEQTITNASYEPNPVQCRLFDVFFKTKGSWMFPKPIWAPRQSLRQAICYIWGNLIQAPQRYWNGLPAGFNSIPIKTIVQRDFRIHALNLHAHVCVCVCVHEHFICTYCLFYQPREAMHFIDFSSLLEMPWWPLRKSKGPWLGQMEVRKTKYFSFHAITCHIKALGIQVLGQLELHDPWE